MLLRRMLCIPSAQATLRLPVKRDCSGVSVVNDCRFEMMSELCSKHMLSGPVTPKWHNQRGFQLELVLQAKSNKGLKPAAESLLDIDSACLIIPVNITQIKPSCSWLVAV